MRRTLVTAAMLAAIAQAALAQPTAPPAPPLDEFPADLPDRRPPPKRGPAPDRAPPTPLFISPSGQPFRGTADGLAAWFAKADANHDGAISLEEFQADAQVAFKLYDTNGDGRIDGFEKGAYETEIVPEITYLSIDDAPGEGRRGMFGGRRGGRGRPTGVGRAGAAQFSLLNEPQPVAAADADVDGKVTAQEWSRATVRRFERLDVAKTGRLTMDGLRPPPGAKKK